SRARSRGNGRLSLALAGGDRGRPAPSKEPGRADGALHQPAEEPRPPRRDGRSPLMSPRTEEDVTPVRVFVVDDHEMVRRGLRDLAEEFGGIEVVGEADRASMALEGIERTRPQVALLDVRLPDQDGVELCREIRSRFSDVRCLMFTSYSDEEALINAIMAGASGDLPKLTSGDDLIEPITSVAVGS